MAEQNGTESPLTAKQRSAAVLVSEDRISDEAICAEIGIGRTTLHRWKLLPEFADAVAKADAVLLAEAMRFPIARKHRRMKVLDDLHTKSLTIIAERAADRQFDAPGVGTGLVIRQFRMVGSGRDARMVEEYAVDTSLMKEIRATQEQAAKETGDWQENVNVTGTTMVRLVGVAAEDV